MRRPRKMTQTIAQAAEVLQLMYDARTTDYFMAISLSILVYDHLITIQEEVRLMWIGSWNFFNYLYFWNRYFSLVVIGTTGTWVLREIQSDNACQAFLQVEGATSSLVLATGDLILVIRVWVLYGRKKGFLYLVLVLVLAELVSLVVIAALTIKPLTKFIHLGPFVSGCFSLTVPRMYKYYSIPALIVAFVGFALTVYKCLTTMDWDRHVRMPIISLFLRDGAIWFLAVFSLMIPCMVLWAWARPSLAQLMDIPGVAAYSIIGSRVLLNLKDVLAVEEVTNGTAAATLEVETIRFIEGRDQALVSNLTMITNEP